jgi:hypothetical protein
MSRTTTLSHSIEIASVTDRVSRIVRLTVSALADGLAARARYDAMRARGISHDAAIAEAFAALR